MPFAPLESQREKKEETGFMEHSRQKHKKEQGGDRNRYAAGSEGIDHRDAGGPIGPVCCPEHSSQRVESARGVAVDAPESSLRIRNHEIGEAA